MRGSLSVVRFSVTEWGGRKASGRSRGVRPEAGYGGVAQLGEHLLCKQGVRGSIPLISTKGRWESAEASGKPEGELGKTRAHSSGG